MVTTHGRRRESTGESFFHHGRNWNWIERFGRSSLRTEHLQRLGEDRRCIEQNVCGGSWTIDGRIFGWSGVVRDDQRRIHQRSAPISIRA